MNFRGTKKLLQMVSNDLNLGTESRNCFPWDLKSWACWCIVCSHHVH